MSRPREGIECYKCMFVFLLFSVLLLCVAVQFLYLPTNDDAAPPYWGQKVFITALHSNNRLGNQLFLFAAAFGVARMHNMTLVFDSELRLRDTFRLSSVFVTRVGDVMPTSVTYTEYGRRSCAYDMGVERLERTHTVLRGYFQSWLYFRYVDAQLRRAIWFLPHHRRAAHTFLSRTAPAKWRTENFRRVAIHARRGDMLDAERSSYGYTVANRNYFRVAMEFFRRRHRRVQFVVCSDDVAWCRENIVGDDVVYSTGRDPGTDMAILALCNDTIMSTGSFSWWAAWLANGTTVYYDDWPAPSSVLEYLTTKQDYFPRHWIPMSGSRPFNNRTRVTY